MARPAGLDPGAGAGRLDPSLDWRDVVVLIAFFISGAAGLVYEICWIRQATALFGSTTFAASSVVAVFFLGLAAGSAAFGRLAERMRRPLLAFAVVELGVATLALVSLPAFGAAEPVFRAVYRASTPDAAILFAARFAVVAVILFPPTFLMGATLPLFCREYVRKAERVAAPVGWLYGINTLGGLAGCLACGLWLLPAFGLMRSVQIGAALGLGAALTVVVAAYARPTRGGERQTADPESPDAAGGESGSMRRTRRVLSALVFAAGFVAIGGQVLWIRFLGLLIPNGVHAYTFTLAAVLLGIVAGSALAARLGDRARDPIGAFGALQIGHGLLVLTTLHLPVAWLRGLGGLADPSAPGADLHWLSQFQPCLLLVVPAILSGASLPLAVRITTVRARESARQVGVLTALNTLGGVVGSIGFGFYLLPGFGLEAGVALVAAISIATGVAAWGSTGERHGTRRIPRCAAAATALALWVALPRLLPTSLPDDHLLDPGDELVAVHEGHSGNVAVIRREGVLSLEIDRWWQGQRAANHQRLAAHLPMLLHHDPRRVLVVGVGAGQTPSRFLHHPVESLDCIEIEPAIFDVVRTHFGGGGTSGGWMDDPRVRLISEDGRSFLAHSAQRYDVISLELGQLFRPSVAPFYNVELYEKARVRLSPGGILTQFLPLAFFEPAELRRAVASFLLVFPESRLWYNTSELLLIGRRAGGGEVDAQHLLRQLERPALREDLAFSHWGGPERALWRPEVLLGGFLLGPQQLARLAAGTQPFRDDRPELEYRASARMLDPAHEVANAELIAAHLAPFEQLPGEIAPQLSLLADVGSADVGVIQSLNAAALVADAELRRLAPLRAEGRFDALEERLLAVHSKNPEHAALNRTLGELALLRGRSEEAIPYLDAALMARPADALALKAKAVALHLSRRVSRAIPFYRAALELSPDDLELLNGLGAAYAENESYHSARRYFERALEIDPSHEDARRNLDRLKRLEPRPR